MPFTAVQRREVGVLSGVVMSIDRGERDSRDERDDAARQSPAARLSLIVHLTFWQFDVIHNAYAFRVILML